MCVDNPREEFADVFDTHPSVDKRIEALIKFAGGHDPGPIALEPSEAPAEEPPAEGPWSTGAGASENQGATPPPPPPQGGPRFLPDLPPVELGGNRPPGPPNPGKGGPWGSHE
jgi:heat shock protein HtpX